MKSFLRSLLPLLLGLLTSCSVYDSIFHPYRLPTPPMSADAKAEARAAETARQKGLTLNTEAADKDDGTTPAAPGGAAPGAADKDPKADNKLTYNELPAGTKLKYDKNLLLKKPKLKRRQYHHYETRPLKPNKVSRENRRLRHHSKGQDQDNGGRKSSARPDAPAPDEGTVPPTERAPAPTPPPQPEPAREKKAKRAPVPKPDPTQPTPK